MAQRERGMVEDHRQLRLERRPEEVKRRRTCGRKNLNGRLMNLDAPGRLRLRHGVALHHEHRLVVERGELLDKGRVVDDDLRQTFAITQDQKADAAELAQAMQPAGQAHALADMAAEIGRPDTFHR